MLVVGSAIHNPPMAYFVGKAHLTNADLIKKRGQPPVLFCHPMERDEAARSGLQIKSLSDYDILALLKQTGGDMTEALALRYQQMLTDLELTSGRMALYGRGESGIVLGVFSHLKALMPDLEVVGDANSEVLLMAMATKDEHEVARIRKMGEITVEVVGKVADLLTSQRAKDEVLVKSDGEPLTIGEVKRQIDLWLAERGAENPEGTIFAIGRDAGVPHSVGNDGDLLRLGQTIIFDIFPTEAGSGYYYDFTRTWCLGYVPDEVQALYDDVYAVYQQVMSELKVDGPCGDYHKRTCELFKERGHPVIDDDPKLTEGFVHGLGHGVGLHVHERPRIGAGATERDRLEPGVVVTIEPGLYYPERGMGCRLEDTVYVRPDGEIEVLVDYPYDLLLPVKA
jgi:Xaa-Pro aminopeptidase